MLAGSRQYFLSVVVRSRGRMEKGGGWGGPARRMRIIDYQLTSLHAFPSLPPPLSPCAEDVFINPGSRITRVGSIMGIRFNQRPTMVRDKQTRSWMRDEFRWRHCCYSIYWRVSGVSAVYYGLWKFRMGFLFFFVWNWFAVPSGRDCWKR